MNKLFTFTAAAIISALPIINCNAEECSYNTISSSDSSYYAIASTGDLYEIPYLNKEYDGEYGSFEDLETSKLIPKIIMDNALSISKNYIIKDDHTLWKWNEETQSAEYIYDNVKKVSAGKSHILFLTTDNTLYGIGSNVFGELAQGTCSLTVDEQVSLLQQKGSAALSNTAICTPEKFDLPVKIEDDVKDITAGDSCSYFLKPDGSLYRCGYVADKEITYGKFNLPARLTIIKPEKFMENVNNIYGGGEAFFASVNDDSNTLFGWGNSDINYAGSPVQAVPAAYSSGIRSISVHPEYNYITDINSSLIRISSNFLSPSSSTVMDDVNCTSGSIYGDTFRDRQMVLKNSGELFMLEFDDSDNKTLTKFKNNIRLSFTEPINVNYNDISELPDIEKSAVQKMSRSGIFNGTSEESFSPAKSLSRAEAAALILRITNKQNEYNIPDFSDVNSDNWFYNISGSAKKYGIMNGFEDNTFRGNSSISGIQFISIAARTLKGNSLHDLSDTSIELPSEIPLWAYDDIKTAVSGNLISLSELKDFISGNDISRSKAAVILYRLYNEI